MNSDKIFFDTEFKKVYPKIDFLNRNFNPKIDFFLSKLEIFVKHRNFCQKIEFIVEDRNFL